MTFVLEQTKLVSSKRLKVPPTTSQRLVDATATAEDKDKEKEKKPLFLEYSLNWHNVALVEATLVAIAHDVNQIELVVFLPALCRKTCVPYVIVKGKARIGTVVHKKTATVVAIQEVKSEDQREVTAPVSATKANFTDKYNEARRQWGGCNRGNTDDADAGQGCWTKYDFCFAQQAVNRRFCGVRIYIMLA